LGRCAIDVGKQLELDDRLGRHAVSDPSPRAFAIGLELCVPQGLFQADGIPSAIGNLEVDLHVDIRRTRVTERAVGAEVLLEPYDPVVFERTWSNKRTRYASIAQIAVDCLTGAERMPAGGNALVEWMLATHSDGLRRRFARPSIRFPA
jgi:hypothetical protein